MKLSGGQLDGMESAQVDLYQLLKPCEISRCHVFRSHGWYDYPAQIGECWRVMNGTTTLYTLEDVVSTCAVFRGPLQQLSEAELVGEIMGCTAIVNHGCRTRHHQAAAQSHRSDQGCD